MKKVNYLVLLFVGLASVSAQSISQKSKSTNSKDYFYELPEYTDDYSAGMVASRMVAGLGFRYYWGTADLRAEDLAFRPSDGARSLEETMDHILGLAAVIHATVHGEVYSKIETVGLTYEGKRDQTLAYLQQATERLKTTDQATFNQLNIRFSDGTEYPFWNLINGPIADAIHHVGQLITFRRTTGNPINPNISVLNGKVRNP